MQIKYVLTITLIALVALTAGCTSTSSPATTLSVTAAATTIVTSTSTPVTPTPGATNVTFVLAIPGKAVDHIFNGTMTLNGQPLKKYAIVLDTYTSGVTGSDNEYRTHTDDNGFYSISYNDASDSYHVMVIGLDKVLYSTPMTSQTSNHGYTEYETTPNMTLNVNVDQK